MRWQKTGIAVAIALWGVALVMATIGPVTAAGETPRAWGAGTSVPIDGFQSGSYANVLKKNITVAGDGALVITGTVSGYDDCSLGGTGWFSVRLGLDTTAVWDTSDFQGVTANCGATVSSKRLIVIAQSASVAVTATVSVSAGDHVVKLQARELGGGSFITSRGLSVSFLPAGTGPLPWPTAPPLAARNA